MLSMLKSSLGAEQGANPITKHYEVGRHTSSCGPELVWKIYDANRLCDNKEASIFIFEKRIADKLHKPRRREMVADVLRHDIKTLTSLNDASCLKILHPIEECNASIAFASEPVFASVANLLGHVNRNIMTLSNEIKDYKFLDEEIKCGIMQLADALSYLHSVESTLHGNICPSSVLVTKRRTWKLACFGFSEKLPTNGDCFRRAAWTSKLPKMVQPDLDYMPPETQLQDNPMKVNKKKKGTTYLGDMFSLGMLICALHNNGNSLILAGHSISIYTKHLDMLTENFGDVAHRLPLILVDPVEKMINKNVAYRPMARYFSAHRYFSDPIACCMSAMDSLDTRDLAERCEFFCKLSDTIPKFPPKLLYQAILPLLLEYIETPDMLPMTLPSWLSLIDTASNEQYTTLIWPQFKVVFSMPRPVQATVYLVQKLEVILNKSTEEDIKNDILPLLFTCLESNSVAGQEASISIFANITKYVDSDSVRKTILPKAKELFNKSKDVRTRVNTLSCVVRIIDSLDKMMIIDEVLPFLIDIQTQDVEVIMAIIVIYKHMLSDKRFGMTYNLLATRVLPSVVPYAILPGLKLEQFAVLMDVMREMLDLIYRQRRNKMLQEIPDMKTLEKRRTSIDMRYNGFDPPKMDNILGNKYLLTAEEPYGYGNKPPSTPELQRNNSRESMNARSYRRHSSFQGLGCDEQANLERKMRSRKSSLVPTIGNQNGSNPHILVSGASASNFYNMSGNNSISGSHYFDDTPRRFSTQSMGPVALPEPGRRDSRGRLMMVQPQDRRSSFQGICESAVQFFVGK